MDVISRLMLGPFASVKAVLIVVGALFLTFYSAFDTLHLVVFAEKTTATVISRVDRQIDVSKDYHRNVIDVELKYIGSDGEVIIEPRTYDMWRDFEVGDTFSYHYFPNVAESGCIITWFTAVWPVIVLLTGAAATWCIVTLGIEANRGPAYERQRRAAA